MVVRQSAGLIARFGAAAAITERKGEEPTIAQGHPCLPLGAAAALKNAYFLPEYVQDATLISVTVAVGFLHRRHNLQWRAVFLAICAVRLRRYILVAATNAILYGLIVGLRSKLYVADGLSLAGIRKPLPTEWHNARTASTGLISCSSTDFGELLGEQIGLRDRVLESFQSLGVHRGPWSRERLTFARLRNGFPFLCGQSPV